MKIFLAFVTACLFWPSAANAQGRTDREQAGLIGPVKSVEAYHISFALKDGKTKEAKRKPWYFDTYNIDGNKTERVFYDSNRIDKHLYIYDTKGRCTGHEAYKVTSDNTLTFQGKSLYVLDDNGNTIELKFFDSDGDLTDLTTYTYDTKGNKIEEAHLTASGQLRRRYVSTYDERGNQTGQISFGDNDSVERKDESVFDDSGNRIESLAYLGGMPIRKAVYKYDEKRRILEEEITEVNSIPNFPELALRDPEKVVYTHDDEKRTKEVASYEPDGSLKERVIYTYDEKGNEIGKAMFKADGSPKNPDILFYDDDIGEPGRRVIDSVTGKTLTEFEYDSRGNWTRETRLVQPENDKSRRYHAVERVITYH
jgi:hypothetical protein